MSWYGLAKFVTGFLLAIALLFLAGAATARYVMSRLSELPPRPVFANDPKPKATNPTPTPATTTSPAVATPTPAAANPTPPPAATPAATPSPTEGYTARVNEPIGLIVREKPSRDSAELGGVAYDQTLTVLETSPDGGWQRVRLADGTEGWVRGGNTDRIN